MSHAEIKLGNPLTVSASLCKHWEGRQSFLSGTPIFMAGYINLVATQAMQVHENECPVTWSHMTTMKLKLNTWSDLDVRIPG